MGVKVLLDADVNELSRSFTIRSTSVGKALRTFAVSLTHQLGGLELFQTHDQPSVLNLDWFKKSSCSAAP